MRKLIWLFLPTLILLHQDYWQWDDASLWFGFLPQTLAYHAMLTCAAATFWLAVIFVAWPNDLAGNAESNDALFPNSTPYPTTSPAGEQKEASQAEGGE